jgi:hypothetical protein
MVAIHHYCASNLHMAMRMTGRQPIPNDKCDLGIAFWDFTTAFIFIAGGGVRFLSMSSTLKLPARAPPSTFNCVSFYDGFFEYTSRRFRISAPNVASISRPSNNAFTERLCHSVGYIRPGGRKPVRFVLRPCGILVPLYFEGYSFAPLNQRGILPPTLDRFPRTRDTTSRCILFMTGSYWLHG